MSSVNTPCNCDNENCNYVNTHSFTINMEHIVQSKDIATTHWNLSSSYEYTPENFYVISLNIERYSHFAGLYAYDMSRDSVVYIPMNPKNNLELDMNLIVELGKVSHCGGHLQWDQFNNSNKHDAIISIMSNYSCSCYNDLNDWHDSHSSYICMHCQIVRRELTKYSLKRALTIAEFMTYLYSHVETTYDDLIMNMVNHYRR